MIVLFLLFALPARADAPLPAPTPPTWAHDAVWLGTAWEAGLPGTGVGPGDLSAAPPGFAIDLRTVSDGPRWLGAGTDQHFRLSRDTDGRTVVDELSLQARLSGLAIRPATGDQLDLSVIGSRWDQTVYGLATPWTQLQLFVPVRVVPLGFSDTDADADHRLHYYAAVGAGFGGDWLVRVAGAFGLHLRAEAAGETMHRVRKGAEDEVRHTVWGRGEADLAVVDPEGAITLGVWTDVHLQWEPRVGHGVQREVLAAGLRIGMRIPAERLPGSKREKPPHVSKAEQQTNAQNQKAIEGVEHPEPDTSPPPPPPTDEEHDANDAANQQKIDAQKPPEGAGE